MKNLTKLLALLLALVMVLSVMAGCAKQEEKPAEDPAQSTTDESATEPTDEPEEPAVEEHVPADTFVVGYNYFSQKFSPFFADTSYDQDVVSMTQLGLLGTDREGNVVFNGIEGETRAYNGTDYTYTGIADLVVTENDDGTVAYDFTMRDDVKFSDGTPMTIDDVIFTMYVLSDPTYTGSSTLYAQPIIGMEEYRSGMDTLANLMIAAGQDNTDFTFWTEEQQNKFWAEIDEAGTALAQEIVDYVVSNYADGYAGMLGDGVTGDMVREDPELQMQLGMALWGYGDAYTAGCTATDYWEAIKANYVDEETGACDMIAAATTETAGSNIVDLTASIADWSVGVATGTGAANISGIEKTGDYSMRVTLSKVDPTAVYHLAVTVAPLHYYGDASLYDYDNNSFGFVKGDLSGVHAKDTQPLGAGPYVFKGYSNGVVSFEANENYFKGCPKTQYIKFQETTSADMLTGVTTGLFDMGEPNFTEDTVASIESANSNGALDGDALTTVNIDFLGYGYIGLNADTMNVGGDPSSDASKDLRKAFATLFAAYREPVINAYYGERASVINYPISNTSWAAPKPADEGYKLAYSTDVDGNVVITADMSQEEKEAAALEMAIGYLKAAGYTWDDASGKFTAAPEGAAMSYEVIIPADGVGDHPAYGILTSVKNALEGIGITLNINDPSDSNELWDALDAGTQNMWTAAWGATVDPDMYQVYHSSNIVGLGGSDSNHYHIADEELDNLIMEARSTTDQAFRKATYKQCLEIIMDWGVEIPTYQRQECFVFSTERVNMDTVTPEIGRAHV